MTTAPVPVRPGWARSLHELHDLCERLEGWVERHAGAQDTPPAVFADLDATVA